MSTAVAPAPAPAATTDRYKWVALSNTTIGMLITTINSSIVLIALPDFAIAACVIAVVASWMRGSHYVHGAARTTGAAR